MRKYYETPEFEKIHLDFEAILENGNESVSNPESKIDDEFQEL